MRPSNAGNTTPSDLVEGENIPFGVQSEPETVLVAGKPMKDAPIPTYLTPRFGKIQTYTSSRLITHTPDISNLGTLPDLYIPGTQILKPQINWKCPKGKRQFCCRWGSPPRRTYCKDYAWYDQMLYMSLSSFRLPPPLRPRTCVLFLSHLYMHNFRRWIIIRVWILFGLLVPGESWITDNPQCIRKQQYCFDSIDSVFAYTRTSSWWQGVMLK